MNEIQSIQALFVIQKGEKILYKNYLQSFRGNKETLESKLSALLEDYTFSKESSIDVCVVDQFAIIFKVFKDFSIAFVSDQSSENQLFISNALEALELCIYNVNFSFPLLIQFWNILYIFELKTYISLYIVNK